jgi:hypothetical protein
VSDPDLIALFIEPLEALGIPYMITGGVASVIYGDPRFTRDVDVVLELRQGDIQRLASTFSTGNFYVPPIETLELEAARRQGGHFNVIHHETALRADVYIRGDDPLHAWAFERRRRLPVREMSISVAPVEYVILRKLQYFQASGSDRHLRDVAMMLRISGDQVDCDALEPWIEELGLRHHLDAARTYQA